MPVYLQTEVKQAQIWAKVGVVRGAAAVVAYRRKHGVMPATLNQAMPQVPADPFDGKPLRYRREGTGFVIFSVGQTGKFDGGTPAQKPDAMEAVFHYPMPAYYAQVKQTNP